MADRTVTVSLVAQVNGYISGMQKAAVETQRMGSEAEKLAKQKEAFNQIGIGAVALGSALAAGLGLAVKAAADFDAQMAQVQTLSHATAQQMGQLRDAALTMGQGIGFSATQVADAETELTKAGVSVKDQLGGALVGALDLAAAGQINVADATEIAASAMTQFKLKGSDVPHIADLLAAGADKALGSVSDLGNALKYVGPVSESLGVSIEQTTGVLAEFAQNGIIGEQAGTELRGVLLSLTAPSQVASSVMQQYGINLYNAKGNFIGVNGAAQQLKDKLGPLDQATRNAALGQIFGNAQITAANVLYSGGAKAVNQWTAAVNDNGFAAQQASGKMNSLNGDLSKLKSAFESGLIETGESASTSLRGVVQNLTGFVQSFDGMSDAGKTAVFVIGSVTAATALLGGGFLTIIPKIAAAKAALATLNESGVTTGRVFGIGGGIAIGLAAVASGFAGLASKASLTSDALASVDAAVATNSIKSLNEQFTGGGGFFDAVGTKSTGIKTALASISDGLNKTNVDSGKFFDGLTFGLTNVSGTAKRFAAQFEEIGTQLGQTAQSSLPAASKSFNQLVQAAGGGNKAVSELLSVMPDYRAELIKLAAASDITLSKQDILNLAQGKGAITAQVLAAASKDSASSASGAGAAASDASGDVSALGDSSASAAQKIQDVADALKNVTSPTLDARSAYRDYQAAIDAVTQSIADNGTTLDDNTDKGRANEAALDQIAQSTETYASALYTQTGSQDQATKAMEDGRNSLIAALGQYGITGQAAQDYADKILGTPTQWATLFTAGTGSAGSNVDGLKAKIFSIPTGYGSNISVTVSGQSNIDATANAVNRLKDAIINAASVGASTPIVAHATAGNVKFATGGPVLGPGTGTSDSINAKLSNGEFVVTAAAASRVGLGFLMALNDGSYSKQAGRFADGGPVTPTYVQAPPQVVYAQQSAAPSRVVNQTNNLYSLDPEPYAQAVIRRQNLGFV